MNLYCVEKSMDLCAHAELTIKCFTPARRNPDELNTNHNLPCNDIVGGCKWAQ